MSCTAEITEIKKRLVSARGGIRRVLQDRLALLLKGA
jgi:hypothetical protein